MTATPQLVSHEVVQCADSHALGRIPDPFPLGPLDHFVAVFIPVEIVFVYLRPDGLDGTGFMPYWRIKRALSLLLDHYPHFTGRLQEDAGGNRSITSMGGGMELFRGTCNINLAQNHSISLADLPNHGRDMFAPFGGTYEFVLANPVFTMKYTQFACGAVALGVRILHTLCDSQGVLQVVQDLAEIYRGVGSDSDVVKLSQPPCIEAFMSHPLTPPQAASALRHTPSLFYIDRPDRIKEPESQIAASDPIPIVLSQPVGRVIRYSSSDLLWIKTSTTSLSSTSWISTFDALCAHLHARIYAARHRLYSTSDQLRILSPPDFLSPVNLRSRISSFPTRYAPQALFTPFTSFEPERLLNGPLSEVAAKIHEMMRAPRVSESEDMFKTLSWISAQPDKKKIRSGFRYGTGSLMLSQWNKIDMYADSIFENEAALIATTFTPISLLDGLGYFLQSADRQDRSGIDLYLALSGSTWEELDSGEGLGGTSVMRGPPVSL